MVGATRLVVSGRVQGVGFRAFAQAAARAHGITGYARNLADGTVEILAEGESPDIESFIAEIESGNGFSRVERIQKNRAAPEGHTRFFVC